MKKTINLSTWLTAFALIGAFTLNSCKKDNSINSVTENDPVEVASTVTATTEEATTEAQFDDVFNITASMNTAQVGEDLGVGSNVSGLFELGVRTPTTPPCFRSEEHTSELQSL